MTFSYKNAAFISYSVFDNLQANVVGSLFNLGSFSVLNQFSLYIYSSIFSSCASTTNEVGGLIVFKANEGNLSISKICVYLNYGYEGSFLYNELNKKLFIFNMSSSTNCITIKRGLFFSYSSPIARDYNTSLCESQMHINFYIRLSETCDSSFFNCINNTDDILIYLGCDQQYGSKLSNANLISNKGRNFNEHHGFICINDNQNQIFDVYNALYRNNNYYLHSPIQGIINLHNSTFDSDLYNDNKFPQKVVLYQSFLISSINVPTFLNSLLDMKCETYYQNIQLRIINNSKNLIHFSIPFYSIFIKT